MDPIPTAIEAEPSAVPDQVSLKRFAALSRARVMMANKKAKLEQGEAFSTPMKENPGETQDGNVDGSPMAMPVGNSTETKEELATA